MNNSHAQTPPVPAHRVVNRNGMLTGKHFFADDTEMQRLLEAEGVKVKDAQNAIKLGKCMRRVFKS